MPALSNIQRLLQLVDEVFATRTDPGQLQVTPNDQKKLARIHAATLSQLKDAKGPTTWVLLIPTTNSVMQDFLNGRITENQILELTEPGQSYDSIYLCSVITLPEYRGRGATRQLCRQAIEAICKDHPIKALFVWPFTEAGDGLAEALANDCGLQLYKTSFH